MEQIHPNQIQPDDIILDPLTDSVYVAQEIAAYHQGPELCFVQPRATCGVKPICLKYWGDITLIRIGNLRTLQTEQIGFEVSQMYKSVLQKCEEINNKTRQDQRKQTQMTKSEIAASCVVFGSIGAILSLSVYIMVMDNPTEEY